MKYLTAEDWEEFERLHLRAYMWILQRDLRNEFEYLKGKAHKNQWEKDRLTDLTAHYERIKVYGSINSPKEGIAS